MTPDKDMAQCVREDGKVVMYDRRKRAFGPWVLRAFEILAWFKRLRGTPLDVFGYQRHRR